MLKAAIVGCGAISRTHADAIAKAGGQLIGTADVIFERAESLASAYGAAAYDSLEGLLAGTTPDVLHICTPHYLHIPMAQSALSKQIHVLTEKPLGLSLSDASEVLRFLGGSVQLGVCYQNRYNRSVRQAKSILESGTLGKINGIRGFVTWRRDAPYYTQSGWRGAFETEGGGVLINQSIHTLDLMMHLTETPSLVSATVANHHLKGIIEVEDTAEVYLGFSSGIRGLFYATTAFSNDVPILIDILCERGSLRIEGDQLSVRNHQPAGEQTAPIVYDAKSCWGEGHNALIADFYDCIKTGRPFGVSIDEGIRVCRVLDAIYQSDRRSSPVFL